tara:strand:+ start:590 stop:748 length:159 start_codon:yes stop_codon:yes gene_type:complete
MKNTIAYIKTKKKFKEFKTEYRIGHHAREIKRLEHMIRIHEEIIKELSNEKR